MSAKFTEINLRIYGPQVVTAAHTLARHPTSKIAKENLEGKPYKRSNNPLNLRKRFIVILFHVFMYFIVFADMWQWLMTDVTTVAKDVLELSQNRPEKQVYMSLPRPGVRINNHLKQLMHSVYTQIDLKKKEKLST